jgi:hypothetical protein
MNNDFEKIIQIGMNLSREDHERIISMMHRCIGKDEFLFFGISLRNNFLEGSGLHLQDFTTEERQQQLISSMGSLSAVLLALYVKGAIVFREPSDQNVGPPA